jgi:hypothetical protein
MTDLKLGDRVEFAPHTDIWMRGDRFGIVIGLKIAGSSLVRVRLDTSNAVVVLPGILTLVRKAGS